VPVADIIARNYNLDIKNPHVGEQICHDPDEMLANYRTIMAEAATIRERLKQELMAALGREKLSMGDVVIYKAEDGATSLQVHLDQETVWLPQTQLAQLFDVKIPAVSKHLKNIFASGELTEDAVISILETTAADGKAYKTKHYSLDAIIAVGYRVNSFQATRFRQWATQVLREHIVKGYTVNEQRLREEAAKLRELQRTVELLARTLTNQELVTETGRDVLAIITDYAYPGRAVVWDEREANIYFQKAIHRVRFLNGFNQNYFVNVLRESADSGRLSSYFTGAGIQHFTGKGLMSFLVPIPPLAEQHRIVTKVNELMTLCDTLKTRLTAAQTTQLHLADTIVEQAVA
jgi:hypothetical protein